MSEEFPKLQITLEQIKLFWSKVDIRGPDECWNWKAGIFREGYGKVFFRRKNRGAHRMYWEFTHRLLEREEYVCHKCDNKLCVNPKHLFLGDAQANMDDKVRKGRHRCGIGDRHSSKTHPECLARGEQHGRSRLTTNQVMEIRSRYVPRKVSTYKLAAEYGVSQMLICLIVRGKLWKHIE